MKNKIKTVSEEILKAKAQLSNLEHALVLLTHEAQDGEKWRISSRAIELHATAYRSVTELAELIEGANEVWK